MFLPITCSNYLNDLQLTKEDPKVTQREVSPSQLLLLPTSEFKNGTSLWNYQVLLFKVTWTRSVPKTPPQKNEKAGTLKNEYTHTHEEYICFAFIVAKRLPQQLRAIGTLC